MFSVWGIEISKTSTVQMRMVSIPRADIYFYLIVSRIAQILLAYTRLETASTKMLCIYSDAISKLFTHVVHGT